MRFTTVNTNMTIIRMTPHAPITRLGTMIPTGPAFRLVRIECTLTDYNDATDCIHDAKYHDRSDCDCFDEFAIHDGCTDDTEDDKKGANSVWPHCDAGAG